MRHGASLTVVFSLWTAIFAPVAGAVESDTQAVTVTVSQHETIEIDEPASALIVYHWSSSNDNWYSDDTLAGRVTAVSNVSGSRTINASTTFSGVSAKYLLEAWLEVIVDGVVSTGVHKFLTSAGGSTGLQDLLTFSPSLGVSLFPGTVGADVHYKATSLDDEDPGSQTFTVTFTVGGVP